MAAGRRVKRTSKAWIGKGSDMEKWNGKEFTSFDRNRGQFGVLADAIAEKHGIQIRREGFWPCTDGEKVNIPEEAGKGPEGDAFLISCVDEMGAVAKRTPKRWLKASAQSLLLNQVYCGAESARVRPQLCEEFRGAEFFCAQADDLWLRMIASGKMDAVSEIVAASRLRKLGIPVGVHKEAQGLLDACAAEFAALLAASTAKANYEASKAFCEKLAEHSGQASEMMSESSFEQSSSPAKGGKGSAEQAMSDMAKELAKMLAAGKGEKKASEGKPAQCKSGQGEESESGGDGESSPGEKGDGKKKPGGKPWNEDFASGGAAKLRPFHTDCDKTESFSGKGDAAAVGELKNEARLAIGSMTRRFELALRSKEKTQWRFERERGSLDARSLSKLAASPGFRMPFKEKRVFEARKTAVSILVDLSGSMRHGRIAMARLTAVAMAEALRRLGVACEVLGFSSGPCDEYAERERSLRNDRRLGRATESLLLREFKSFGDDSMSGLSQIELDEVMVQNPDGEGLAWAATRLSERKEERKILFALSDGSPETDETPRDVLAADLLSRAKAIGSYGIELVGVGIQTDSVKRFYPEWVVVNDLNELAESALKQMEKILLAGALAAR